METISTWFNALDPTMKAFWCIAIFASTIFLIQMVMTFIGIGDADIETDFDMPDGDIGGMDGDTLDTGGTLQLFSVRNIVNFLLGVGWGGVCLQPYFSDTAALCVAALLTGFAFVAVFAFIFKQMRRLEHDGAFNIHDCVGKVGDVYLRIPGERRGEGKVQYSFQGSVQELAAITNGREIPSGAKVRVLEVIDNHTLLVEQL